MAKLGKTDRYLCMSLILEDVKLSSNIFLQSSPLKHSNEITEVESTVIHFTGA